MEFKIIFYVIAIIGWLFFKFFEKQKDLLKKVTQTFEPPIAQQEKPPIKSVVRKPVKLPMVKKVLQREEKNKPASIVEKKSIIIAPQINKEMEVPEFLETPSYIEEIRTGNVDWRKAILLAEILRPV